MRETLYRNNLRYLKDDEERIDCCPVCGERYEYSELDDNDSMTKLYRLWGYVVTRNMCRCDIEKKREQDEKAEREAEETRQRELRDRIWNIEENGYLDRIYSTYTWDKDFNQDSKASQYLRRYVDNWEEMYAENIGLLFTGKVGTGKTFYASCIANSIKNQGDYVLIGNVIDLLKLMSANFGEERERYERRIREYPLVVLDDFGVERATETNLELLFDVIDMRYRMGRPMIITTNRSMSEIQNEQNEWRERMWSRILEVCIPFEITGEKRPKLRNEKQNRFKAIMQSQ